eukprot:scaffold38001_cov68-Cyclotella_meneghiniana.AAC.1
MVSDVSLMLSTRDASIYLLVVAELSKEAESLGAMHIGRLLVADEKGDVVVSFYIAELKGKASLRVPSGKAFYPVTGNTGNDSMKYSGIIGGIFIGVGVAGSMITGQVLCCIRVISGNRYPRR